MKKIIYVTTILCLTLLGSTNLFSQCNDGQITCYGSYTVTDSQTPIGDYYLVYIKVTNLCPSSTGWIFLTTLYSSDLGNSQSYNGQTVTIGIPTGEETYYYWTIHIRVDKYVHDEMVDSKERSEYAARSGTSLTAYNPITVPFD